MLHGAYAMRIGAGKRDLERVVKIGIHAIVMIRQPPPDKHANLALPYVSLVRFGVLHRPRCRKFNKKSCLMSKCLSHVFVSPALNAAWGCGVASPRKRISETDRFAAGILFLFATKPNFLRFENQLGAYSSLFRRF
jgi:hypothetical protein